MELDNIKRRIFDIFIIGVALVIANNIYKAQNKTVALLKEKKGVELKRLEVLNDIDKSYKNINAVRSLINKKDISMVVNSLADIAKESNIQIDLLKPSGEEKQENFIVYPFDLTVNTDSYHKLGKFISRLESSPDYYVIRKLDFNYNDRLGQGKNKLIVNLIVTTVLIKD